MGRRPKRAPVAVVLALGVALTGLTLARDEVTVAAAASARNIKIMTWNVCGGNNPYCRFYTDPDGLVAAVREYMRSHDDPTDAAILQEFCRSFARPLEAELEAHYRYGWDVRFVPVKIKRGTDPAGAPNEQCDRGRGDYGLAIALPDENTWWDARYLPSPEGTEWRVALCATVESWRLKLCNTHLSSGSDDPTVAFRARQVVEFAGYVWPSPYRVVFGGDLNLRPNASQMAPAYDAFVECAQQNRDSPRAGPGTYYTSAPYDNERTAKIDYLFTNPGLAPHTCTVAPGVVDSSDHRPMWMTLHLPVGGA